MSARQRERCSSLQPVSNPDQFEEGTAFSAIHDKQFPNPYGGFITVKPFIVGDSAFALAPYMIRNSNCNPPEGSVEHAYDYVHIRTRYFAAT